MQTEKLHVSKHERDIKAVSERMDAMKNINRIRDFQFLIDEPAKLGGTNEAPTPMDYILGSLNGCILIVIETIAREINFSFQGLKAESIGTIDRRGMMGIGDVSPHFQKVTNTVWFDTVESEERIEELKELLKKRCPAYNLFRDAGIDITLNWGYTETEVEKS